MTNPYATIRAALALVREPYGTAGHAELQIALAKLAELEKAASEPVMYQYLHPWGGEKIWREEPYWNGNISIVSRPLYAATQISQERTKWREPTEEECERIYSFWISAEGCIGRTPGERMGRIMFAAVREVMGGGE